MWGISLSKSIISASKSIISAALFVCVRVRVCFMSKETTWRSEERRLFTHE